MGKEIGAAVKYDGPDPASVSGQVEFINNFVNQGYAAIAISALSPDGLCEALKRAKSKGIKVLTWDSDVNPECRSSTSARVPPISSATCWSRWSPIRCPNTKTAKKKIAFHYSSPTVTDQKISGRKSPRK